MLVFRHFNAQPSAGVFTAPQLNMMTKTARFSEISRVKKEDGISET